MFYKGNLPILDKILKFKRFYRSIYCFQITKTKSLTTMLIRHKNLLDCWTSFGWDKFFHSSLQEAMFQIWAEDTVDNTGIIQFLLNSTNTVSRAFLLLTLPHQQGGCRYMASWKGTQAGQMIPSDQKDIPLHRGSCST